MKYNFIQSTIILLIGGFFTKILGMIIKVSIARIIGNQGLGLYMMILPTFILFITIGQFGLPVALSKLISEDTRSSKKLFFSVLPIALIMNTILVLFIILLAPVISHTFLRQEKLTFSIYAMALVIPFTTISSMCRSYFFGKAKMIPHVLSNFIEEIMRLLFILKIIPLILPYGIYPTVVVLVLANVVSEGISTITLLFFLPKKIKIYPRDFIPNRTYMRECLEISVPNTASRFIGTIGYFFEPIIVANVLSYVGYSSSYITNEYGILSGYIISLLLLPSFFTLAISQALFPTISRECSRGNYWLVKRKIKQAVLLSFFIGFPVTIFIMIRPVVCLSFLYHTNKGVDYLLFLAPICLLQYLQAPLSNALEAMGKSKDIMKITLISTVIRSILTFLLSFFKIGIWGLVIAISINIIFTTIYELKKIKTYL